MGEREKAHRLRTGWLVLLALAVVTGFEFWLSTAVEGNLVYLTMTALVKATLIIIYFMHVSQLKRGGGEAG